MQRNKKSAVKNITHAGGVSGDQNLCILISQEEVDKANKYRCKQTARRGKVRKPSANLPCTLSNLKIKQENDDRQT